jgi:hypothetical protein
MGGVILFAPTNHCAHIVAEQGQRAQELYFEAMPNMILGERGEYFGRLGWTHNQSQRDPDTLDHSSRDRGDVRVECPERRVKFMEVGFSQYFDVLRRNPAQAVNALTVKCESSSFVLVIKDPKLSGNLPKEKRERIYIANPRSHSIPNRSRRHRPTLQ